MTKKKRAVIVGIERTKEGKLKLTLDDLIQSNNEPSKWIKDVVYTYKEYEISTFEQLDFDDKELADFGYSILARLYAFYEKGDI